MSMLFQPCGVCPMNETESASVEGFADIIKMWRNGTIGDVMELIDAVKAKDAAKIRASAVKIASGFGYSMEAKEVDDVVAEVMRKDWAGVVYEAGDMAMKFAVAHMGYIVPTQPIVVKASPHIDTFTGEQARAWLADNRGPVKQAGRDIVTRFRLRNAPEVLKLMRGEATAADLTAIDPDRLETIIGICRAAIPLLKLAGAFFPPCTIAAIVLQMIVAWYDANHPVTADAVNAADKGLSLGDLL